VASTLIKLRANNVKAAVQAGILPTTKTKYQIMTVSMTVLHAWRVALQDKLALMSAWFARAAS
jgi:hypothetical protein